MGMSLPNSSVFSQLTLLCGSGLGIRIIGWQPSQIAKPCFFSHAGAREPIVNGFSHCTGLKCLCRIRLPSRTYRCYAVLGLVFAISDSNLPRLQNLFSNLCSEMPRCDCARTVHI